MIRKHELPGWSDERIVTEIPYARFVQMMRVIHQMESRAEAWDLFVHGAAKKNETFTKYARRVGAEARTPESTSTKKADAARTVQQVQKKLGRFYRAPRITA